MDSSLDSDRPVVAVTVTVVCRGVSRSATREDLHALFAPFGRLVALDAPRNGICFVHYADRPDALRAVDALHGATFFRRTLAVRLLRPEVVVVEASKAEGNGSDIAGGGGSEQQHSRVVPRNGVTCADGSPLVFYTARSLRVGNAEYPFPTGLYLTKLVELCHSKHIAKYKPIIDILSKARSNHAKEISEAFGIVHAVHDLGKRLGVIFSQKVLNVYIPGDGATPFTGAALCTIAPETWHIYSIDPKMKTTPESLGIFAGRLHPVRCRSQEFRIPASEPGSEVDFHLVLAVHSHCPLQEFYDRVPQRKFCVSLPCCGLCGFLKETILHEYDDFEIFSPKRRILVFSGVQDGLPALD